MFEIDLLKNHPHYIPHLSKIWHELLGKKWVPDVSIERVEMRFGEHLNDEDLPLTWVAIKDDKPIGMCSLRVNDGIREDLTPWLGSLIVDQNYQKKGVAQQLMETVKVYAKDKGFQYVYLFTFDRTLPEYYKRHGWEVIGLDVFKSHPVTVMRVML